MANLGKQEKTPQAVAVQKQKEVTVFPDVRLDSKMLGSIKECELDEKYVLTFVAKVSSLGKPDRWDLENKRFSEKDVIASFKLIDGSIRPYRKDKSGKEI